MPKMRTFSKFLASTAPIAGGALALVAAAPAQADTTVNSGTSGTLRTSSAGNVTISSTGTLTGSPGAVVTVDSSNTVNVNSSGIIYAGTATSPQSGAIGVQINPGVTTTITNAGAINVLENYDPTTADPNHVNGNFLNGPVSAVSGRFGIYAAAGGTITGSISNVTSTGSITVDGENSAGIRIDSALAGSLNTQGAITVLGDNSQGVRLSAVAGSVTIGGTVTAIGSGSQGYVQSGDVTIANGSTGVVTIDGAVSNGYTYTDTSGVALTLSSTRFNTNTPVVEIDGNVAGGILLNAPTSSTSTDTNRGSITAYGNNPALQIGGATNIVIGANANTDNGSLNPNTNSGSFALGLDGSITASAAISGVSSTAVSIGGRGGNVTLTGGAEVYGTITANTVTAGATGILINAGSTVPVLFNSGTIRVTAPTNQEVTGNLIAVQDLSGTLANLTNQGNITVTGATQATSAAIDLSRTTGAITLTQSYTKTNQDNETTDKSATTYNPLTATLYASINGNILLGTGANTVNIQSGAINGNTTFGSGSTNTVTAGDVTRWVGNINVGTSGAPGTLNFTLNNYAQFTGTVNLYGGAGSLTLNNNAIFLGTVTGGNAFNVAVSGGTFGANSTATTTINSLNVASGGALRVYIDGSSGTGVSSKLVANSATFASGAKLSLAVNQLINTVGTYDVLSATTLNGASTLTASSLNLPVLFTGSISNTATDVYVTIGRATPASLGLTTAQTAAYTAILNDTANNTNLQNTLLQIYDTPTLRGRFNELLPNYDGGTFDTVTRATRIANEHFTDDSTLFSISDAAAWFEPIVFHGGRIYGDTPGFKSSGGGISTGFEKVTPIGNVGFQLAWLTGSAKQATFQSVKTNEFELGLFWRRAAGPLYLWAGGNLGRESFDVSRTFFGQYTTTTGSSVTTTNFTYRARGHWAGWSATATAGASYTVPLGEHFSLRPRGSVEYDRLEENHYIESGDTPIALTVAGRQTSQITANTTLMAKWSAGPSSHEGRPFSVELEGGRRSWISGQLGTTTGTFETGDVFNIQGGHLPSAWIGNLSVLQGGLDYTWRISTDVERNTDKSMSYGIRASIAIAL